MNEANEPRQNELTTETKQAAAAAIAAAQAAPPERGVLRIDGNCRIIEADMAGLFNFAKQISRSELIPQHYRNREMDCMVATMQAMNLKVPVLTYMQHSCVIHGKPAIESKLAVAMLNQSGKIKGRIEYDYKKSGDKIVSCTARCVDAATERVYEAIVDEAMVTGEGWASKAGSKWKTMPSLMFAYRSAMFLIRQYYPETLVGNEIAEDLEDFAPPVQAKVSPVDRMRERGQSVGV